MIDLRLTLISGLIATTLLGGLAQAHAAGDTLDDGGSTANTGPIRLGARSTANSDEPSRASNRDEATRPSSRDEVGSNVRARPGLPLKPTASEFETYASQLAGTPIERLGSDLMLSAFSAGNLEANRQVPPDYVVGLGDEIQLTL